MSMMSFLEKNVSAFWMQNVQATQTFKDSFNKNEKRGNLLSLIILVILNIDAIVTFSEINRLVDNRIDIFFRITEHFVILTIFLFIFVLILSLYLWKKKPSGLRYLMTVGSIFYSVTMTTMLDFDVAWYFLIPSLSSCLYYRPRYTIKVSLFMLLMIPFASVGKELVQYSMESMANWQSFYKHTLIENIGIIKDLGRFSFNVILINTMEMCMEMAICTAVAYRGLQLTIDQSKIANEQGRLQRDLEIAEKIQTGLHPVQFMETPYLEISASMVAADSVGGDLYDFFQIDDTHVCILVADVSGNGIPAAIYSAAAKTLINTVTKMNLPVESVFEKVNAYLCDNNTQKLFITAWLGIINTETGIVNCCNAGHNPPCILRMGQKSEFIKTYPNFILARKKNIKYRADSFQLNPGDCLYLYTDGVTEANNSNGELFGNERLLFALDSCSAASQETLSAIQQAVSSFTGESPQSDDITMLMLKYKSVHQSSIMNKKYSLDSSHFDEILQDIESITLSLGGNEEKLNQIKIATSEIVSNIAYYAFPDVNEPSIDINIQALNKRIIIDFIDEGIEFNPLNAQLPEIGTKKKKPGGFGIFIVKKLMDSVSYKREEQRNILRIEKDL